MTDDLEGESREIDEQTARDAGLAAGAAALSLVPVVGGLLAQLINELPRDRARRQEQFLGRLATAVTDLGTRVDADFVRTEEFAAMTEEVVEKAARRREMEKRDYWAAALANTATHARPSEEMRDRMVATLERLRKPHLRLLKVITDTTRSPREEEMSMPLGGSVQQTLQELIPNVLIETLKMEWADLSAEQLVGGFPAGMMTGGGAWNLRGHLTDYGKRFLQFVTLPYTDVNPPSG